MRSTARVTDAIRGHGKAIAFVGSAAALISVGTASAASAATVAPAARAPAVVATHQSAAVIREAGALLDAASKSVPAGHGALDVDGAPRDQVRTVAATDHVRTVAATDHARTVAATDHVRTVAAKRPVAPQHLSWNAVARIQAHRTDPSAGRGSLPAQDQLRPVGFYGPQEYMPIGSQQMANATTIVKQALAKRMGVRSAVIAVATSMQESTLNNISYGTSDSLGLFQQRPSCGWGTAEQIMNPTYSSDAFLNALQRYQAANPGWVHQPLYETAQGVQGSAFPAAYAKWEAQAAGLVQTITTHLTK